MSWGDEVMCFRVAWQCYKRQNQCCRQLNASAFRLQIRHQRRLPYQQISILTDWILVRTSWQQIEDINKIVFFLFWYAPQRRMNLIRDGNERSIWVHCINEYSYHSSCVETRCCSIYCIPHGAAYSTCTRTSFINIARLLFQTHDNECCWCRFGWLLFLNSKIRLTEEEKKKKRWESRPFAINNRLNVQIRRLKVFMFRASMTVIAHSTISSVVTVHDNGCSCSDSNKINNSITSWFGFICFFDGIGFSWAWSWFKTLHILRH